MSESTAALIPFDRLFKFTSETLKADYRVNLFKEIKRENAELLGLDADEEFGGGEEYQFKGGRNSGDDESDGDEDKEEEEDDMEKEKEIDTVNPENTENTENNNKKKTKKTKAKKMRELEYDYDDPFIDDSEITDVYQSVFELMRGGGDNHLNESDDEDEDEGESVKDKKKKKIIPTARKSTNYFVYRGTMTPEILAKEFEISVGDLLEDEQSTSRDGSDGEDSAGEGSEGSGENGSKKREKKRKRQQNLETKSKKVKTEKPVKKQQQGKQLKKPKTTVNKPVKPSKPAKPAKPTDLIAQSAKKFNDLFSTEDGNSKANATAAANTTPVFNVNGVDANLLELREVMKRFRDAAMGTSFSPGKFPSVLRPRLNETICTCLRLCRPTVQAPLPKNMLPALASFLPFSPTALNKLLTRKILGPLIESIEKGELVQMYGEWRGMVEKRISEDGAIVEIAGDNNTDTNANTATGATEDANNINNTNNTTASPVKRKLKFSDEMRQLVFEIIRAETDLNNLIALSKSVESSAAAASTESVNTSSRAVQSELNLRKNVYQKLVNLSMDPVSNTVLLSTTEISKEFGAQKRKHEKRVAKVASEILFGEVEVEDFLRELDVKKVTDVSSNVGSTVNSVPVNQDPLNLFNNNETTDANNTDTITNANTANTHAAPEEAANTSLFIDSNQ